jgi:hypothetical protein
MGSLLAMHLGRRGDPVTLVLSSPTNDSSVWNASLVGTFERSWTMAWY